VPEEVISDTSPIQYLHQVGHLYLLPSLYASIIVPEGVVAELAAGHARGLSLPNLEELDWVNVLTAPHLGVLPLVTDLGQGEREVLSLATERPASLSILDDRLARHFAQLLGISFTGTLGVLLKAQKEGHLTELEPVLDHLENLGFRLDSATRKSVLEIAGET